MDWLFGIGAIVTIFALSSSPSWGPVIILFLVLVIVYGILNYEGRNAK